MDTFFGHRQLSALDDLDLLQGPVARCGHLLNHLADIISLQHLTEHNVLAIQPATQGLAYGRSYNGSISLTL